MKQLIITTVLALAITCLKAQDNPSDDKVHFVSAKDLKPESMEELTGDFVSAQGANTKQLRFSSNSRFEKNISIGQDSLVSTAGTYGYNPGGWLMLKPANGKLEKYTVLRFDKFRFLISETEQKEFESEFERKASKFKYSSSRGFKPDEKLLEICQALSDRYFVQQAY